MVSPQEKREILNQLIDLSNQKDNANFQKKLIELLLKDTNNGKLYKYRYFDNDGYSLDNLTAGTLHCASPLSFNDPFDCKIGITLSSIIQAKYETEFDIMMEIYNKFLLYIKEGLDIEACTCNERSIIEKLLCNEKIMNFATKDYGDITEEQVAEILYKNGDVIIELLQVFADDEIFSNSLGVCQKMIPQLIERISPDGMLLISKSDATYEDFAKANGVTEDTDEIELTMLMSQKMYPEHEIARQDITELINDKIFQINDKLVELFLIGCLCTDFKNRLMWSHYADSHRGFCIEYDFSELTDQPNTYLPLPIYYTNNRPTIPWKAAFENTPDNISEATAQIMLGLLTKDNAWEYENEWRILIPSTNDTEFKMPKISCVYLGVAISEDNRQKILKIAKEKQIPVKQMKVDRGIYELHAEKISNK